MVRNTRVGMLVLGVLTLAGASFVGTPQTACAEIQLESTTFSLGDLILRDEFSDNFLGLLWSSYEEDPNNVWVEEVNERLELRSTVLAGRGFAGYVADGWRINTEENFALRIDFHHDLRTKTGSWINIGLSPSPYDLDTRRVTIGVGCDNDFAYYWYERRNYTAARSSYAWRPATEGTIYIAYDAAKDELYVGDAGYEAEDAWTTFTNLIQRDWEGAPLYVYFGGRAEGLQVDSGRVYLDNFYVEDGTVIEVDLQEVYRFWSPALETHFYTMSEREKDKILTQYADVWVYEGAVFYAYPDATDPDTSPVYRFWSEPLATHFYTISMTERDKLIDRYSKVWTYEGVAFHAYEIGYEPEWAMPVYRFWSEPNGTHVFTISESERDKLLDLPKVWTYEGIAWYAGAEK